MILPFYTPQEIETLDALYHQLHPVDEKGFFPSTFSKNKNYRHEADVEIRRIGDRSIEKYCTATIFKPETIQDFYVRPLDYAI